DTDSTFNIVDEQYYIHDDFNPLLDNLVVLNTLFKKTFVGGHVEIAEFLTEYYKGIIYKDNKNTTIWYYFNEIKHRWIVDKHMLSTVTMVGLEKKLGPPFNEESKIKMTKYMDLYSEYIDLGALDDL
ncbi:hypothetical protein HDU81_000328, partial [Chytriomyces hyalinus]